MLMSSMHSNVTTVAIRDRPHSVRVWYHIADSNKVDNHGQRDHYRQEDRCQPTTHEGTLAEPTLAVFILSEFILTTRTAHFL